MKKIVGKSAVVLLYVLLLCIFLKLKIDQLFDFRLIGLCLFGGMILCVPLLKRAQSWQERGEIWGRNALMAGYLEAFMLLFASMNDGTLDKSVLIPALALDLRPILYGFLCYLILCRETKKKTGYTASSLNTVSPITINSEVSTDLSPSHIPSKTANQTYTSQDQLTHDASLTKREQQIVSLIRKGLSNREIAEELFISETTVKKHVSNIFEKTGVSSRKEL